MSAEPHTHQWRRAAHIDGCHFYEDVYGCSCGAFLHDRGERNAELDPYSFEWFDEDCERCSELACGAKPQFETVEQPA